MRNVSSPVAIARLKAAMNPVGVSLVTTAGRVVGTTYSVVADEDVASLPFVAGDVQPTSTNAIARTATMKPDLMLTPDRGACGRRRLPRRQPRIRFARTTVWPGSRD